MHLLKADFLTQGQVQAATPINNDPTSNNPIDLTNLLGAKILSIKTETLIVGN
jgi:hypothetical protein